jgi:hypothetical protein
MSVGEHEQTVRPEASGAVVSAVNSVTPVAAPTGDARVDEALARLEELGQAPVSEHVEIFDDVHRRLRDVLASVDQGGPTVPAPAPPRP